MYAEFIGIYVGLGVLFLLGAVNLVLLIVLLKKSGRSNYMGTPMMPPQSVNSCPPQTNQINSQVNAVSGGGNVVFCKKCATAFDPSVRCCPRCGTSR